MKPEKVFHISENGDIEVFQPRPSPSHFDALTRSDVVFAISERLLHNYLLPRDCPRVTFYAGAETTPADREKFLQTSAAYVVAVEARWLPVIEKTVLFCYEFDAEPFFLIDECAGYYAAYETIRPVRVRRIENILAELLSRNDLELRILPELWTLADRISASTLNFSIIRMRNATPRRAR